MNTSNDFNRIVSLNMAAIFIYKYILFIIYIIGNIGNLFTLFLFSQKSWKKNVCVFYFKVSLIINLCYNNSTIIGIIFIYGFQIVLIDSNIILCKFYFYTFFLFTVLAPSTLILASIDRLLLSSQNIDTRLYSSKRLAYFLVSINTSVWIIFNLHAFIQLGFVQYSPSRLVCTFYYSGFYTYFVSYSLGLTNMIFCLIMIILCVYTFKNVRQIRQIPRTQRAQQIRSMTNKDFQLLRCLYLQDICFLVPGITTALFNIYQVTIANKKYGDAQLQHAIVDFVSKFLIFLFDTYYPLNFLVFIIVSKAFRNEIKRLSYKMFGKQLNIIREEKEKRRARAELNETISTIEVQCR